MFQAVGLESLVHLRSDAGDVEAVALGDEVTLVGAGRGALVEPPLEQPAVELLGGIDIGLIGVDPAGDPGRIRLARCVHP